jgi:CrcB protein
MATASTYLLVALGSALGGVTRFWLTSAVARHFGSSFPWGTIIVNVTGSLIIGFFATITAEQGRYAASLSLRQFFMVGICGGYTTFSAFSLQTLELARLGSLVQAGANVVLSVICCLLAVWLGHLAATALGSSR